MTVIESPKSLATTSNPKDLFGAKKVSLSKLPAVAVAHGAHAMMDGARKYGAYNWRDKKVLASIYVDAARRHIDSWFEGQKVAGDSGVHHLGHAIACAAILLDAEATGNLVDDRPAGSEIADKVYNEIAATIAARTERARIDQTWADAANESTTHHAQDQVSRERDAAPNIPVNGQAVPVIQKPGEHMSEAICRTTREAHGLPRMQEQHGPREVLEPEYVAPETRFGFTVGETVNLRTYLTGKGPGTVTGFNGPFVVVRWRVGLLAKMHSPDKLRHGE